MVTTLARTPVNSHAGVVGHWLGVRTRDRRQRGGGNVTRVERMPERTTIAAVILSPGVAHGYAVLEEVPSAVMAVGPIDAAAMEHELERLRDGLARARAHLTEHVRAFHAPSGEDMQQIVGAHLLILDDSAFFETISERIRVQQMTAEVAVEEGFGVAIERLLETDDAYLQSRVEDLRDSCHLVLRGLGGGIEHPVHATDRPIVLVTPHLRPSAVLRARRMHAVGFITSGVANASHAAILLRAYGLPALGGVALARCGIADGTEVLIDGIAGVLHLAPTREAIDGVNESGAQAARELDARPEASPPLDAVSANGEAIKLWANVDDPSRMDLCARYRLHGVGLFRTEFLVLTDDRVPAESEQIAIYRRAVERLGARPMIVRTFDIGAEKVPPGLHERREANPALGLRGLRRQLRAHPDELRTQLRAILQATRDYEAAVLLPMVTHVSDVIEAKRHLDVARAQLEQAGVAFNRHLRVGAMVEVPAAVLGAIDILAEVDFVCVGTNDLSQYLAAADRDNPAVSSYLDPSVTHVFEIVAWLLTRAQGVGRRDDVLIGGELASEPQAAARFCELGARHLIVRPASADAVRAAIAAVVVAAPTGV